LSYISPTVLEKNSPSRTESNAPTTQPIGPNAPVKAPTIAAAMKTATKKSEVANPADFAYHPKDFAERKGVSKRIRFDHMNYAHECKYAQKKRDECQ
jgi:hypothetical protein